MMRIQPTLLLMISLVVFSSCQSVPPPVADLCGINAFKKSKRCYQTHEDYDENGKLKHGAQPTTVLINGLQDLNGHICVDPDSFAEIKIFVDRMREKLKQCQQQELHDARTFSAPSLQIY